jgi:hypothetical protein
MWQKRYGVSTGNVSTNLILTNKTDVLGIRMQRNDAISYLKQLLGKDIDISPDSISLDKKETEKLLKSILKLRKENSLRKLRKSVV